MKIQLDLDKKTLKLEENANFGKVYEFLQKTFPETWKDFTIETNVKIEWNTREVFYPYIRPYNPHPFGTYCSTLGGSVEGSLLHTITTKKVAPITLTCDAVTTLTSGVHDIELN